VEGRVLMGEWWRGDVPSGGLVLDARKFYNYKIGACRVFRLKFFCLRSHIRVLEGKFTSIVIVGRTISGAGV
jgi:hypothetical protein